VIGTIILNSSCSLLQPSIKAASINYLGKVLNTDDSK
jgi:hypothetical protein